MDDLRCRFFRDPGAVLLQGIAMVALACGPAWGLPPGRAWLPVDILRVPGHSLVAPDLLEQDSTGVPVGVISLGGGIGYDTAGLAWRDSAWVVTWRLGYGTAFVRTMDGAKWGDHVLWNGVQEIDLPGGLRTTFGAGRIIGPDSIVVDTVMRLGSGRFNYAGAVRGTRRWVLADDLDGVYGHRLRILISDSLKAWREIPISGYDGSGITIASVSDTSLLAVWASADHGVKWGELDGTTWTEHPPLSPAWSASSPRLRQRPSGGFWLSWGQGNGVVVGRYRNGTWTLAETLRCATRAPEVYHFHGPSVSRDEEEYPVLAWAGDNDRTLIQTVCVCIPSDSGFTVADEIEGSEFGVLPAVTRDRNGDVWVAWQRFRAIDGMHWTHTYVTETTDRPQVRVEGRHRRIDWNLTGPAPGSWWAVLRSRGGGPFEEVARVRAGPDLAVSWTDSSPPEGPLEYQVRRECVDRRFEWLSEPAAWAPANLQVLRFGNVPAPFQDGMRVDLAGARSGDLTLRVYDLQGRLAFQHIAPANGTGQDTIRLDFGASGRALAPGVYFLRARDSAGQLSNVARLVLVR